MVEKETSSICGDMRALGGFECQNPSDPGCLQMFILETTQGEHDCTLFTALVKR